MSRSMVLRLNISATEISNVNDLKNKIEENINQFKEYKKYFNQPLMLVLNFHFHSGYIEIKLWTITFNDILTYNRIYYTYILQCGKVKLPYNTYNIEEYEQQINNLILQYGIYQDSNHG